MKKNQPHQHHTYLVGGAVRDELLGLEVKDRDWVVVGSTPKDMLEQGFQPVGKDFPVFLHPDTKEEYALARTEKKTGIGYQGFSFYSGSEVSLEEDLLRRDLTINAIAKAPDGRLIDPYGGQRDIAKKTLRHVSPAFAEDPLRVLRVARFAARFATLGFTLAPETLTLMRDISLSGELKTLSLERIWQECERALSSPSPATFFSILSDCSALKELFPELANRIKHDHSGELALLNETSPDPLQRYVALAVWVIDQTPNSNAAFLNRCATPRKYQKLAELSLQIWPLLKKPTLLSAEDCLQILEKSDAFRQPDRFAAALLAWRSSGTLCGLSLTKKCAQLSQAFELSATIRADSLGPDRPTGPALGKAIYDARLAVITATLN